MQQVMKLERRSARECDAERGCLYTAAILAYMPPREAIFEG